MLAEAESPKSRDKRSAVNSLIPHPPTLIGKVIEKRIIGENTKNER